MTGPAGGAADSESLWRHESWAESRAGELANVSALEKVQTPCVAQDLPSGWVGGAARWRQRARPLAQ